MTNPLKWANLGGLLLVLLLNTLANTLPINGLTTGELSALYPNRFVPAGFTFSIWGVIYLALAGFVAFQFRPAGNRLRDSIGQWFFLSCLANASWILAWHYMQPILALLIMLFLLWSLVQIYLRVTALPFRENWPGILPFQLYLGWICIATIANTTAVLTYAGWDGGGLAQATWAAIMAAAGTAIGLFFLVRYKDIAFGLVVLWALYGIYSGQAEGGLLQETLQFAMGITGGGVAGILLRNLLPGKKIKKTS